MQGMVELLGVLVRILTLLVVPIAFLIYLASRRKRMRLLSQEIARLTTRITDLEQQLLRHLTTPPHGRRRNRTAPSPRHPFQPCPRPPSRPVWCRQGPPLGQWAQAMRQHPQRSLPKFPRLSCPSRQSRRSSESHPSRGGAPPENGRRRTLRREATRTLCPSSKGGKGTRSHLPRRRPRRRSASDQGGTTTIGSTEGIPR